MNIEVITKNNTNIAIISSEEIIISNSQDALDLLALVSYDYSCDAMIISKKNLTEEFFDLKNGIAGGIMQKHINYRMALAIVGEFDQYDSQSLKSLIYESNKGKNIFFKRTLEEAVAAL